MWAFLTKLLPFLAPLLDKLWPSTRADELRAEVELEEARAFSRGRIAPRYLLKYVAVILLSLFASNHSDAKRVTKINRLEFDDILNSFDLGSVIYPKYMTCDFIVQYVRALQNEAGSNIKTLYRILDDRVEALEFTVHEVSAATGVPLSELHLKPNLLLCCITRGDRIIIPRGGDTIQLGDTVIVVTLQHGLHDLRDIVAGQGGARR